MQPGMLGRGNVNLYEFADKHPLWTLVYLTMVVSGVVGFAKYLGAFVIVDHVHNDYSKRGDNVDCVTNGAPEEE